MTVIGYAGFFQEVAIYTLHSGRRRETTSPSSSLQQPSYGSDNIPGHLERNSLADTQAFGLAVSEVGCHHILHGDAHGLVDRDVLIRRPT